MTNLEPQHEEVYGKSFALYGKAEMREFIDPFYVRFERNTIDPAGIFAGRRCLDAGCGNGRGAIFMMTNGAASVDCVDVSATNVASAAKNLNSFGFSAHQTHLSTIERLPFPDQSFDFVWCNGVIMHTANPDTCLAELARVLRSGGQCWLYVYGTGGLYWWMVRQFRKMLAGLSPAEALAQLQLMRYPARYVAEYIDDWKVPYLRTYSVEDLGARLTELGFDGADPLHHGLDYDTSQRRNIHPEDAAWVGDGDLRYLLTKRGAAVGNERRISSGEFGSEPKFAPVIEQRFGGYFLQLAGLLAGAPTLALAACAHLQRDLRDIMSRPGRLDIDAIEVSVARVVGLVGAAAGESGS